MKTFAFNVFHEIDFTKLPGAIFHYLSFFGFQNFTAIVVVKLIFEVSLACGYYLNSSQLLESSMCAILMQCKTMAHFS